jgi:hypothetical protein
VLSFIDFSGSVIIRKGEVGKYELALCEDEQVCALRTLCRRL